MFESVSSRADFPEMEKKVLQFWKDADIFHRSEEGDDKPLFMLYEGPPTANGSPGIHHVLARVYKDIICRYKTMKGFRCLRKGGWDTHGLPVELEVENELGLKSKRDIEEYGIERFNQKCRESVFRYVKDWEAMTDRIGFWVDMEHPYVTLDNEYIETGWWVLRQLWDKGLVYQDYRVTPHCPRCVTSLSSHEVALGYQEDTPDPSVFVRFRLSQRQDSGDEREFRVRLGYHSQDNKWEHEVPSLLVWTTTPWTLTANVAAAVSPVEDYILVSTTSAGIFERLILAEKLADKVLGEGDYEVIERFKGSQLTDIYYDPPYNSPEQSDYIHRILPADFVSTEDGTGIIHIAPAYGAEDSELAKLFSLPTIHTVNLEGALADNYPGGGRFIKDSDEELMQDLHMRGLLYHRGVYRHTYPFCWRCATPLLYYAKPSWYIRTTSAKARLVEDNRKINWYPEYIKEGRFGEWLANNVDWAFSRERFWGTPIPLWQCGSCGEYHCIGGVAELREMAVPEHKHLVEDLDMHRPYVDEISIRCPKCSGEMRRIPEVMDAWYDSGAMPFAQYHVTSQKDIDALKEAKRFPADYICEAVDQTRGWFYSLHALSVLLTDQPSYRNVICLGLILDGKGQKMSKHQGNVVDPWSVLDAQGADATRWYLFTASQPGESRRFSQDLVNEVVRRFLLTLWNVHSFFTTYASVDKFHPDQVPPNWKPTSELDRWVLSELNSLVSQVDRQLDEYSPTDAGRRIQDFVDRLSNWYVRRSRRRFWKSESDEDKTAAYATLHICLTTLCKLMAPFTPFVAEEIYQSLVRSVDDGAPESVHLADFPQADPDLVDQPLMDATRLAMRISSMGRGARSRAGVKVRQPLSRVLVRPRVAEEADHFLRVQPQILEELNIKELQLMTDSTADDDDLYRRALEAAGDSGGPSPAPAQVEAIVQLDQYWVSLEGGYMVAVDTSITPDLGEEGLARELVHRIQNLRRAANFEITDRINTYYQGPEKVARIMKGFADYIQQETLSAELVDGEPVDGAHSETQKVEGEEVVLGVRKI